MAKRPALTKKLLHAPKKTPRTPKYPDEHRYHHPHHPHKPLSLETLKELIMAISQSVAAALDAQDVTLAALSKKVDDFIAAHPPVDPADDAAVVARVEAQGKAVNDISAKLV
jgi:hypothetical protein